jgi:hypothetical protein
MRLYTLYMERDGRKVPIGTFVCGSDRMTLDDMPSAPPGIRYLDPEEVLNADAYEITIRRYEELARTSPVEEARSAERTAMALRRRLHEIRSQVPH